MEFQIQTVIGVGACDTTTMKSPSGGAPGKFEVFRESVAVTEGGIDVPLDVVSIMAHASHPTLAPMFFQSEGTEKSNGSMPISLMGAPLASSK
jgi:hypothetical protein